MIQGREEKIGLDFRDGIKYPPAPAQYWEVHVNCTPVSLIF